MINNYMKNIIIFITTAILLSTVYISAQSPIGIWKTTDDKTGEEKSLVQIYEEDGQLYGKVHQLLLKPADTICKKCKGDKKDQPVQGMIVLESMKKGKEKWEGGMIMDPENGKMYKCKIYMESDDRLKVRGYIGFEKLGRNQFWTRVE